MTRSKDQQRKAIKKKHDKKLKRETKKKESCRVERLPNGDKVIHMNEETSESLKKQKELFVKTFGREPGPTDPVFFDPDITDTPTALSEDKIKKNIRVALEASKAPQEVIYAFEKTGFLVTDFNKDQFSISEMEEWDHALAEYRINVQ